jgi:hypothetical protein
LALQRAEISRSQKASPLSPREQYGSTPRKISWPRRLSTIEPALAAVSSTGVPLMHHECVRESSAQLLAMAVIDDEAPVGRGTRWLSSSTTRHQWRRSSMRSRHRQGASWRRTSYVVRTTSAACRCVRSLSKAPFTPTAEYAGWWQCTFSRPAAHLAISSRHCSRRTTGTTTSVALVGVKTPPPPCTRTERPAADFPAVYLFARMSAHISTVLPRPISAPRKDSSIGQREKRERERERERGSQRQEGRPGFLSPSCAAYPRTGSPR